MITLIDGKYWTWEVTEIHTGSLVKLLLYINKKLQLGGVQPSPTTSFTLFSSKNAASFLICKPSIVAVKNITWKKCVSMNIPLLFGYRKRYKI